MTDTDLEIIQHLDFDEADVCEAVFGCDGPAAWLAVYNCCGKSSLLCDPCKIRARKLEKAAAASGKVWLCSYCLAVGVTFRYVPL